MKIRYFGFLAHKIKKKTIPLLRKLINPEAKLPEKVKETVQEMMLRVTKRHYMMQERENDNNQKFAKTE